MGSNPDSDFTYAYLWGHAPADVHINALKQRPNVTREEHIGYFQVA
jgi:hypothetical protein